MDVDARREENPLRPSTTDANRVRDSVMSCKADQLFQNASQRCPVPVTRTLDLPQVWSSAHLVTLLWLN